MRLFELSNSFDGASATIIGTAEEIGGLAPLLHGDVRVVPAGVQMTAMSTASGQPLDYERPERTVVGPHDIYIHLRRTMRYAGAVRESVLQHSALCVALAQDLGYGPLDVALVAAHDLHEAYVLDLPTGLKQLCPEYRRIEDAWAAHVHRQIGLPWPLSQEQQDLVKIVDLRALVVEMSWFELPLLAAAAAAHGGPATKAELKQAARYLRPAAAPAPMWDLVWDALEDGRPG